MNADNAIVVRSANEMQFAVVVIDGVTAKVATQWLPASHDIAFIKDADSAPIVIGPGDVLDVSIVSTSQDGFLDLTNSALSPISTASLPQQEVGSDGMVSIPPVGRVPAQGMSVQAFQRVLERRLGAVLVDPSVIVRLTERRSARVSVLGDVSAPGSYSINQNNVHLVELLAEAGGPTGRSEELEVSVSRAGATGKVRLNRIYEDPRYNIRLRAGDVISVEAPANRLTVLGAGNLNVTLTYNESDLTLVEALGMAGGLVNRRADSRGIFIYREIPVQAAAALGIDVTPFGQGPVPTIFNMDLTDPEALFAARDFKMGEQDMIYISNSLNEEISALFSVFTNFAPTPAEYVRDGTIGNGN